MGRSYLSIKLAAVFGLLVAAAVTAQERSLRQDALVPAEVTAGVAVPAVRPVDPIDAECELRTPARTPPATARAPRAPAARSS